MLTNGKEYMIILHHKNIHTHCRHKQTGRVTPHKPTPEGKLKLKRGGHQVCNFTFYYIITTEIMLRKIAKNINTLDKRELFLEPCRPEFLARTSAFLQAMATVDSLPLLLLPDLNVLLDVHSWRGRDRHS